MPKIIAVSVGDPKGIGIEILINSWKNNKIKNFILFSDIDNIYKYLKSKKIHNRINLINKNTKFTFKKNKLNIYSYKSISNEDNTYKSLKYAYKFCKNSYCIGLITLPLRKDLIKLKINKKFNGHTEYFQNLDKKKYSNMILYHKKIIVCTMTTHVSLKSVPKLITKKNFILNKIVCLNNTLTIDFNIKKPKIIISGLNPHAGENGMVGNEEKLFLLPIIKKLQKKGINIHGPYSADSMLINNNLKEFDCFIFLYHDQALIPFKYISQFSGVNYTGNLDIIRTSPDHGTAYNLIGKKNISIKSFLNCYKLINKIHKNIKINAKP